MSVVLGGSHDVRLASDETAAPATAVELILAQDEEGNKRWRELRVPPIPPRQSSGFIEWTHKDPTVDLVFAQDDLSGGALQAVYNREEPNKYAQADGVDCRWANVITLGMQRNLADFLLINGGAERNATTGWTAGTGVTHSTPSTPVRTGNRTHQMAISTSGAAQTLIRQDLANPTVYQSRTITVIAYCRRSAGTESGILLRVSDSVGSTDSSTVSTDAYTYVSVTRTIDATATFVRVELRTTAAITVSHTFLTDDIAVVPAGGVVWAGKAENTDLLYSAAGRCILQWNETDDVWNAVNIHATTTITDIISYNSNIFVAYGAGTAYRYGTGTTWTTSDDTVSNDASEWVVNRAQLWKSVSPRTLRSSSSPTNSSPAASNWSGPYTVGSSDRVITRLYSFGDGFVVGKEDGAHIYRRVYDDGATADTFLNVTNEFEVMVHPDNFANGVDWHGWLYLTASLQSLFRFNGQVMEDLSSLVYSPRLTDFGGRIRAIAADPIQLWALADTPTADTSATKTSRLLSLRQRGRNWLVHTVQSVDIGDINELFVNRGFLYAVGRRFDTTLNDYIAASWRWTLPSNNVAPAYDTTPAIESSGTVDLPIWHGGMPETVKATLAFTIVGQDLDANHTVAVRFGMDGQAPSTTLLGTFNGTGRVQTLFFNTITGVENVAIGRHIQVRLTLTTTNTVSPKVYDWALHTTLRAERTRAWELFAWIGKGVLLNTGNQDESLPKATVLSRLSTLETQSYPIVMEADFDGDAVATTVRVHLLSVERVPVDNAQVSEGVELFKLILQEADVS